MAEEQEKILSEYIVANTAGASAPAGSVNSVPQNVQTTPPAPTGHPEPIPVQPQAPALQSSPPPAQPVAIPTAPHPIESPAEAPAAPQPPVHAPVVPSLASVAPQQIPQAPQSVHPNVPAPSSPIQSQNHMFAVPPLPPRASLTPVAAQKIPLVQQQKPKKSPARFIKLFVMSVFVLLVLGTGSVLAMYRFAPATVFRYAPASVMSKLNALWPLHHTFAEMLPTDTLLYSTITFNPSSDQGKQLTGLLARIPGVSAAATSNVELEKYVSTQFGVSLKDDIAPIVGNTAYVALESVDTKSLSSSSAYVALPLKDLKQAAALLAKVQSGSAKQKLIYKQTTYHGVPVYLMPESKIPNVTVPPRFLTASKYAQSIAKLAIPQMTAVASAASSCGSATAVCADSALESGIHPSIIMIDRFLVLADSEVAVRQFIDDSLSKKSKLADNASFKNQSATSGESLISAYVNFKFLAGQLSAPDQQALYKGMNAWAGSLTVDQNGFKMKSQLDFDPISLDPNMAQIFKVSDTISPYATLLPASTALFIDETALPSRMKLFASLKVDSNKTLDQLVKDELGVSLIDLASAFKGNYAFSFQPDSKNAFVFQADVSDAPKARAALDALGKLLTSDDSYVLGHDAVGSSSITSLDDASGADMFVRPSYTVTDSQLIMATSLEGVKNSLQTPVQNLTTDARYAADFKILGDKASSRFFVHSKRFYNGVVSLIRSYLDDSDSAVSDQEKVIDAYLDVFPSFSGSTRNQNTLVSSAAVLPVTALPDDKRKEIDGIIKSDANNIFSVAPFLQPFATSQNASKATTDSQRVADVQSILKSIAAFSTEKNDYSAFKTDGIEKLGPDNAHVKLLEQSGDLFKLPLDPSWPDYYYSLESDGSFVRVEALLETKPVDGISCMPTQQIRGRWTFCVDQKI